MLLLGLATSGCKRAPLVAPSESTITLAANPDVLPVNGTAEIIATVVEQAGTTAADGTEVIFTTTLGTIEPREARTSRGTVRVRFSAGPRSGIATVGALSGSAAAEEIELVIGGAAIADLVLTASPGTVPATGGTVRLAAILTDLDGNRVSGVPVSFSASAGTLGAGTVVSNLNGEARTTLRTNLQTDVTASAGGLTASVTIRLNTAPTVTVSPVTTPFIVDEPADFSVTVTPGANGSPIQEVMIDFGDGTRSTLGALSGSTTVSHVYRRDGSFLVTVTARDASGETTAVSTTVQVEDPPPLNVTISVSPATITPAPVTVTFTATVTPATTAIARFEWDFGDGTTVVTSGPQTSHVFREAAVRTVTVLAVAVDGTEGTGRVELVVP